MIVMAVELIRDTGRSVLGNVLVWETTVRDLDGDSSGAVTPTITVTPPTGAVTHPTLESIDVGVWRFSHTLAAAGRHLITSDAGAPYGLAVEVVWCDTLTTDGQLPTVGDWQEYAGGDLEFSWSDDQIAAALATESAAQRARIRPSAVYSADVREALLRRITCNLARRGLPLGVQSGDSDRGPLIIPLRDPEVRRLEAPYRRLVVG